MTIKALFPSIRPTLNLDFAKTKALDPRVTFTRIMTGASVATYVGADGLIKTASNNVPRFDHNPATGESLGLLVEEARTNLIYPSEPPPRQNGLRMTYTTGPSIVRPDGTTGTVNQLITDTFGSDSYTRFTNNVAGGTANVSYTGSIWIRTSTGTASVNMKVNEATLYFGGGNTYTVTTSWQRITNTSSSNSTNLFFDLTTSSTLPAGTVFYIWGAQLEAGSFATSYIPTTTATVTRAADVASMTGTNFSSWYRQDEGTLAATFTWRAVSGSSGYQFPWGISQDNPNQVYLGNWGGSAHGLGVRFNNSGITSSTGAIPNTGINIVCKTATAMKSNNFSVVSNASTPTTYTGAALASSMNTLFIMNLNLGNYCTGTIARLAYYPVRLSDTQLQALTAT